MSAMRRTLYVDENGRCELCNGACRDTWRHFYFLYADEPKGPPADVARPAVEPQRSRR